MVHVLYCSIKKKKKNKQRNKKTVLQIQLIRPPTFTPRTPPTEKEIGPQIVTCKLVCVVEPTNRTEKLDVQITHMSL